MSPTAIEWTDETWNPTTGCDRVSPGCANCYALKLAGRMKAMGAPAYQRDGGRASGPGFGLTLHPDRLDAPLHWKKPRRIFVNSMSDLFHEDVPDDFLDQVFRIMAEAKQHIFQVLTKRPERMQEYIFQRIANTRTAGVWSTLEKKDYIPTRPWPLPNVWLGTSVENQHWADVRLPILKTIPAAVTFASLEPLLSPIIIPSDAMPGWVICGGESGGPARYMKMEWLESLVRQTRAAGVPLFVKQDSGKLPGRWGRIPEHLRIREYPSA